MAASIPNTCKHTLYLFNSVLSTLTHSGLRRVSGKVHFQLEVEPGTAWVQNRVYYRWAVTLLSEDDWTGRWILLWPWWEDNVLHCTWGLYLYLRDCRSDSTAHTTYCQPLPSSTCCLRQLPHSDNDRARIWIRWEGKWFSLAQMFWSYLSISTCIHYIHTQSALNSIFLLQYPAKCHE